MTLWQMLWRLFWHNRWHYLLFGYLAVQGWVIFLAPALLSREFFDTLSGHARLSVGIYGIAALLLGMEVARVCSDLGTSTSGAVTSIVAKALVRKNLMQSILTRPGARALPGSPGEAVSRFRDDCDLVEEFLKGSIIYKLAQGSYAVVALVTMLRINTTITVLVFVPLVAIVGLSQLAGRRLAEYRKASREAGGRITGAIGEIFGAVQAIKVANAAPYVIAHFDELNEQRRRSGLSERLFDQLLGAVFSGSIAVSTGFILLLSGSAIQAGSFTVGDFVLFTTFMGNVTHVVRQFGTILTGYRQTRVSYERLGALLQGEPAETLVRPGPVYMRGPLPALPLAPRSAADRLQRLEASGLTYRFPDTRRGIEDVSLHLRRGTLTVVTGRIGSGKTTLLRVLLGLLPRHSGTIRWNGAAVDDPASVLVPPRCAYTPQVPRLFSESLQENILLGLPPAAVDLPDALHLAVLNEDVAVLEQGLSTVVGPRGVKLSGGQAQRTAAARMFVAAPELLVVDDLSSALDVETERTLWERLFTRQDSTVLAVSHRRTALRRADHIIVLESGCVADEGTLDELLGRCAEMRRLWADDLRAERAVTTAAPSGPGAAASA